MVLQNWTTDRPITMYQVKPYELANPKPTTEWLLGFFLAFIGFLIMLNGGWKAFCKAVGID